MRRNSWSKERIKRDRQVGDKKKLTNTIGEKTHEGGEYAASAGKTATSAGAMIGILLRTFQGTMKRTRALHGQRKSMGAKNKSGGTATGIRAPRQACQKRAPPQFVRAIG